MLKKQMCDGWTDGWTGGPTSDKVTHKKKKWSDFIQTFKFNFKRYKKIRPYVGPSGPSVGPLVCPAF